MRCAILSLAVLGCVACSGDDGADDAGEAPELDDAAAPDAADDGSAGAHAGHDAQASTGDASDDDSGEPPMGEELASPAARAQIASYRCPEELDDCGGDPVGRWALRPMYCHSNIDDAAYDGFPLCHETITRYAFEGSGTIEFTAGGVVDVALTFTSDHHMRLDRACLMREADGDDEAACLAYEASLNQMLRAEGAFCEWDGAAACECDFMLSSRLEATTTYVVSGTTIDDGVAQSPFCVDGDVMHINLMSSDGMTYTGATFDRIDE